MKRMNMVLITSLLLLFSACQPKVDIAKEKEAIISTFEQEKSAFFNQDFAAEIATWVQESTSFKNFMGADGETRYEGWQNIEQSIKKEIEDTTFDRKLVKATFSDFRIDVMEKSAWVTCNTHWDGIFRGDTITLDQTRISVLKKENNTWKFTLMAIYNIPKK
jgi:hypothetical protein